VPDERIPALTKYWSEIAYKEATGVMYCWSGKDAKLLQRLLSWGDTAFGVVKCFEELKKIMSNYLRDHDGFVANNKWSFSYLASNPQKWVFNEKKQEKREVAGECGLCRSSGRLFYNGMAWRCRCSIGSEYGAHQLAPEEAYRKDSIDFYQRLAENPIAYLRGLKSHGEPIKKHFPELYSRMAKTLSELLGRDRAVAIWKGEELPELDPPPPLPLLRPLGQSDTGRGTTSDPSPCPDVRSDEAGLQHDNSPVCEVSQRTRELVERAKEIFAPGGKGIHTEVLREKA
jgi:hypothetical protein